MDYLKLKQLLEESIEGKRNELFAPVMSAIHCMSRPRVYSVLNACVSAMGEGEVYVEVGTYQGGSLISALLENNARAIGVDSFSEFKETNSHAITKANLDSFGVGDRVQLLDMPFSSFFDSLPDDFVISVYYYDGAHDFPTQLAGMEAAWKFLRPGSLILIDDFTYPEVNAAVNRFVANHGDKLQFVFVMLPDQSTDPEWWNGVVVMKVL